MACGTPVIAFNKGAVPEIVVDGKTGFVVESMDAMIEAVDRIDSIHPRECREHVQNHFSITSMAGKYSELYHLIIDSHKTSNTRSGLSTGHPSKPAPHGIKAA
jgi:glycosyltransferase involved in cell wall biosynthesis